MATYLNTISMFDWPVEFKDASYIESEHVHGVLLIVRVRGESILTCGVLNGLLDTVFGFWCKGNL